MLSTAARVAKQMMNHKKDQVEPMGLVEAEKEESVDDEKDELEEDEIKFELEEKICN
jgi:hypothetical protein